MKTPFNPVAKHCFKFNRPKVEKNKKKEYNRRDWKNKNFD